MRIGYLIIFCSAILLLACSAKKQDEDSINQKVHVDPEFRRYLELFNQTSLPLSIDSLFLESIEFDKISSSINDSLLSIYSDIPVFKENCGKMRKYNVYPHSFFIVNSKKIAMTYLLSLNNMCSFEANYCRVFLAIMDLDGSFIDYKEIAALQELWGYFLLLTSTVNPDGTIEIRKKEYKEIKGTITVESEVFYNQISENGLISSRTRPPAAEN